LYTDLGVVLFDLAGGMTHWETGTESEPDPSVPVWRRPYHRAGASNIEMTAYGLLVYTAEHKVFSGTPILKWLASQRNPNGGFSSSQVRLVLDLISQNFCRRI